MSDQFDNEPEIRRAPPRARQTPVKKKKPQNRRAVPRQEDVRAEAPVSRMAPRPAPRPTNTRDPNREPARRGAVIVTGRDGEQLTRRHTTVGDKYDVPLHEIPVGWEYQWNAVTILNQGIEEIVRGDLQMHANGFRAVPASRHPGRWTPHGFDGQIVVEGLRLEERPASLGVEAREEDKARAKAQVRDRTDALRLTQAQLPGARVASDRNNAGGMRMSIDPGLDIPVPEHEIEE